MSRGWWVWWVGDLGGLVRDAQLRVCECVCPAASVYAYTSTHSCTCVSVWVRVLRAVRSLRVTTNLREISQGSRVDRRPRRDGTARRVHGHGVSLRLIKAAAAAA